MNPTPNDVEQRVRARFAADAAATPPPPPGLATAARAGAGTAPGRRPRRVVGVLAVAAVIGLATVSTVWVLAQGDEGPAQVTVAADGRVPDRPGAVVPLPSSGWEPGDDALAAAVNAVVTVDAEGCVSAGLLWPEGYAARREADGTVSILDPTGKVVLREGDRFTAGGGPGPKGRTCGPPDAETFAMMSPPQKAEVSTATPPPSPATT